MVIPRILSVCETARGGVGRYQEGLRHLNDHGFDLTILLPKEDVEVLQPGSDQLTFRRGRRGLLALFRTLRAFWSARRLCRPDLYFFNSTFTLLPLLALRLRGDHTAAIYCAHCWAISNYPETSIKGRVVRAIEGRLAGLADVVVNVSHGDASLADRLGYAGRQVVIENAVPDHTETRGAAPFRREDAREIHLLFVGRFDRQKGLDILLPAFQEARSDNPMLRLHLVGDVVRDGVRPVLPQGVTHHGWRAGHEIDAYYAAADVLVVPSRWEGLPLVVPEALRNGTPVLVANTSGMASLVTEGVTGGVFALDQAALTQRLASLDRTVLQGMRTEARASYENRFSMQRFNAEMTAVIDDLLGRNSST